MHSAMRRCCPQYSGLFVEECDTHALFVCRDLRVPSCPGEYHLCFSTCESGLCDTAARTFESSERGPWLFLPSCF